jgi:lipopolysaccharide transport system ATP-binding protein
VLNDRNEAVDVVTSGQSVTIALDYEGQIAEPLRAAVIKVKFFNTHGQPLYGCLSSAAGDLSELPSRGRLLCRIPNLPLMPGMYPYAVWCTAGGVLEDHVLDAGQLSVADGDFFGPGKLPEKTVGDLLVGHT